MFSHAPTRETDDRRKIRPLMVPISVCVLLLAVGCRFLTLAPRTQEGAYVVEAVIIQMSEEEERLLRSDFEGNMSRVMKRKDTEVIRFPTVSLLPGQEVLRDERRPVEYREPGEVGGPPGQRQVELLGEKIKASIREVEETTAVMEVSFESRRITAWHSFDGGKLPEVRFASTDMTVKVVLGEWFLMGGLKTRTRTPEGVTTSVTTLTLLRCSPPCSQQGLDNPV